jgi:hypothetical protein
MNHKIEREVRNQRETELIARFVINGKENCEVRYQWERKLIARFTLKLWKEASKAISKMDEEVQKRFTPKELLLYRQALEYSFFVHTLYIHCTY